MLKGSLRQRKGIILILSICTLALLAHCVSSTHRHSRLGPSIRYQNSRLVIPEQSPLRTVVHVETVHLQPVVTTVIVPATVQTIPAKTVSILPPLSGQITRI